MPQTDAVPGGIGTSRGGELGLRSQITHYRLATRVGVAGIDPVTLTNLREPTGGHARGWQQRPTPPAEQHSLLDCLSRC